MLFYLRQFSWYFDNLLIMNYGFAAIKGNFLVIFEPNIVDGVLMIMSYFFEFVSKNIYNIFNISTLLVDQLK